MVDIFVRSTLGQFGSSVLDFYFEYSLWINALILLYFLLVILSRRCYSQTLVAILHAIEERYPGQIRKKTSQEIASFLVKQEVPWEAGLTAARFPLICSARGWRPRAKNIPTLQKIYPVADLAVLLGQIQKQQTKTT